MSDQKNLVWEARSPLGGSFVADVQNQAIIARLQRGPKGKMGTSSYT